LSVSLTEHQNSPIIFLSVLLLIALSNLLVLRRLPRYGRPAQFPRLSVLVPARNEEANIGPCVRSLLAQDYPDFELLVLDDESSDQTAQVLASLARSDKRLRVLSGQPLPAGWLGKQWACHQLSQAASGELLLFTDADTRYHPQALSNAVAALLAERTDMLSAVLREEVVSWGERLIVPVLLWSIFSFLPLGLAYRLRLPAFTAANGQFLLFRRRAYAQIGGHAAVRQHATEDLALVRHIVSHGLRWRLVDAGQRIRCRMYQDFSQAYEGLSKNLFAVFDYHVLFFVLIWAWLGVVFLEPPLLLALSLVGVPLAGFSPGLAIAAMALALLLWGLFCWRFGFPLYLAGLYPVIMALVIFIALRSLLLTLRGRTTWKGRTLSRPKIHWL